MNEPERFKELAVRLRELADEPTSTGLTDVDQLEAAADALEILSRTMTERGASNLKEWWAGLSTDERRKTAAKGGIATWEKHSREEMSGLMSAGQLGIDVEERRRRASKGAEAMREKYSEEERREWARLGGLARARLRTEMGE